MKNQAILLSILLGFSLASCGKKSGSGLRIPDGDVAAGKVAFVEVGCHSCHTIQGENLPPPRSDQKVPDIGGETAKMPTDGQLLTAIINPNHRISLQHGTDSTGETGDTLMPSYADTLTVRQLLDLVAYLHTVHHLTVSEAPF